MSPPHSLPSSIDIQRQLTYLQAVVSSMPQGISVFDEQLRLRVWNQGFLNVLELPNHAVYEGVPFADLIRIPASRGEYGPGSIEAHVQRITALAHQFEPHCFERTRPNGKTHLVQGEPLTLGDQIVGFITTYTDITERKAAETLLRKQRDQLQTVLESIPSAVSLFNQDAQLELCNSEFGRLLELPETLTRPGTSIREMFRFNAERGEYGSGDPDQITRSLMQRVREPSKHHFERTRPNGKTLEIRGVPLAEGGFVTVYTDITERRHSAEREQLAQKVYSHSPAGIIFTDEAHRILSINPATTQMTGYEPFELQGQTVFSLIEFEAGQSAQEMSEQLVMRGTWNGELAVTQKNGQTFPAGTRINRVDDPQSGLPAHYVWILADITERKEAEDRMRHIAQTDALTGLPNRMALLMRLAQILPDARRHQWKVAMMFLDLDRFKTINDTLGHGIGDELLCRVSERFLAVLRPSDTLARLGGDEFTVLLPDVDSDEAIRIAHRLQASLREPVEINGSRFRLTTSIGVVETDEPARPEDLLRWADAAMYEAKAQGRDRVCRFDDRMLAEVNERNELDRELSSALDRGEFELHFQPEVDIHSGRVLGCEALVRWRHPIHGLMSADRFIPLAEENGAIVGLGCWVLRTACHTVVQWRADGIVDDDFVLRVNLSPRQLELPELAPEVANLLESIGLAPSSLCLEVTETAVMRDVQAGLTALSSLHDIGVTLAIDDFGTGYSSLSYLKRFPLDVLKIDRSFVDGLPDDLDDLAITGAILDLARSLDLVVTAEGVETEEQRQALVDLGCRRAQGYLFARPMPAVDFVDYVKAPQRVLSPG